MKALIALAVLFIATVASATWYPGLTHAHSTFSDGQRTPEVLMSEAITKGCQFLIVTDHYEYIDHKEKIGNILADDFGFDQYQSRYRDNPEIFGVNYHLIVLPCAELMFDGPHLLLLGDLANFWDKLKAGSLLDQLGFNQQQDWLSIAAHPSKEKYWFDRNTAINGIEFFNEGAEEYQKTRAWYLELVGLGKNIFATSGWDTHNPATDQFDGQRRTWLYTQQTLSRQNIIGALRNGQTYAANWGVYLKTINHLPGFQYQPTDRPKFFLTLGFGKKITSGKAIKLYRGSELVKEIQIPKGQEEYNLEIEDTDVPAGRYSYIIEVENCLITSPIRLHVSGQSATPRFTGGAPILIGMNYQQVVKLFGRNPDDTGGGGGFADLSKLYWIYQQNMFQSYTAYISFERYGRENRAQNNILTNVHYGYYSHSYSDSKVFPGVSQIVPKEILARKPDMIGFNIQGDIAVVSIVSVWFINNWTFGLISQDTRHELIDEVSELGSTGRLETKYRANRYSLDIKNHNRAIMFFYADEIANIVKYNKHNSSGIWFGLRNPTEIIGFDD